jgi:hypothetical protein
MDMVDSRLAHGLLAGALAALLVLAGTRGNAPGVSLDGAAYVGAADALVHTGELRVPFGRWDVADSTVALSHWAPGMSLLIAAHAAGLPVPASARLVLALSAFATVLGLVLLTERVAGRAAAVLAATLAIATPDLVRLHVSVWSEPPFLACLVALLALMVLAPDRPLRHGLVAAAAVLLRYAGVAFTAAAALWALARPASWRTRLGRAGLAALPTALTQAWWAWRTVREGATIRNFHRRPFDPAPLYEGWHHMRLWLTPAMPAGWARTAVIAAAALAALALAIRTARRLRGAGEPAGAGAGAGAGATERRLYAAAGLLAACYVAVVLAARFFADPYIPMDGRLFSPIIVLVEVALAVAVGALWPRGDRAARVPATAALGIAALGLWVAAGLGIGVYETRRTAREGNYLTNEYWRTSGLLEWVRREGRGVPIYSNHPSAVYIHAGRPAREMPLREEESRMREFGATLARTQGVLVAFDEPSGWLLPVHEVANSLALRQVARFQDGVVWAASERTARECGVAD